MVIPEALKACCNAGKQHPELYYFRVQGCNEVDLIINRNNREIVPVEIKGGRTFDVSSANELRKFVEFSGKSVNPTVLYACGTAATINGIRFDNYMNTYKLFGDK